MPRKVAFGWENPSQTYKLNRFLPRTFELVFPVVVLFGNIDIILSVYGHLRFLDLFKCWS